MYKNGSRSAQRNRRGSDARCRQRQHSTKSSDTQQSQAIAHSVTQAIESTALCLRPTGDESRERAAFAKYNAARTIDRFALPGAAKPKLRLYMCCCWGRRRTILCCCSLSRLGGGDQLKCRLTYHDPAPLAMAVPRLTLRKSSSASAAPCSSTDATNTCAAVAHSTGQSMLDRGTLAAAAMALSNASTPPPSYVSIGCRCMSANVITGSVARACASQAGGFEPQGSGRIAMGCGGVRVTSSPF